MKYTDVLVSSMLPATDCFEAIDKIEADPRNYSTSLKTWNEGGHCILKDGAKAKIKALTNKAYKLCPDDEEE